MILKLSHQNNKLIVKNHDVKLGQFSNLKQASVFLQGILKKNPRVVIQGPIYKIGPNPFNTGKSFAMLDAEGRVLDSGHSSFNLLEKNMKKLAAKRMTKIAKLTGILDKMAEIFEKKYSSLGINKKVAHDFALRCDMISDYMEKNAQEHLEVEDMVDDKDLDYEGWEGREEGEDPVLEQDSDEDYMEDRFNINELEPLEEN